MAKALVTLITSTGHRPDAWALCVKFMMRQTYLGPIQWVVISDSATYEFEKYKGLKPQLSMDVYAGLKKWRPGINTQRLNLDFAISKAQGEYVFVIEDDDWYAPQYLQTMVQLLEIFEVAGEGNARYYNLRNRSFREMKNYGHSSLCQTGFRRNALPLFEEAVNSGEYFIDIEFWRLTRERKVSNCIPLGLDLVVGMKGLPGRTNLGVGGKADNFILDGNGEKLKEWVGEDYLHYSRLRL